MKSLLSIRIWIVDTVDHLVELFKYQYEKPSVWIQIQTPEGFSSSIWNVLLKWALYRQCRQSGWKAFCLIPNLDSDRRLFIPVFEMPSTQMNRQCRQSRFGFRKYRKAFHPVFCRTFQIPDEKPSIWIRTSRFGFRRKAFHPVFCLTIQIRIQTEGFSSGIWNVLLKWSTFRQSRFGFRQKAFHPVFEMSTQMIESRFRFRWKAFHPVFCRQSGFRWKAFHPVFEMFYSNEPCINSVEQSRLTGNSNLDSDRRLFIRYLKCSTQMIDSVDNLDSDSDGRLFIRYFVDNPDSDSDGRLFIWYLKCSTQMIECPDSDSDRRLFIRYFVDNPDSDSDGRLFIRYLKCSTQMIHSVDNPDSDSDGRLFIRYFVDNPDSDSDGRLFIRYLKCSTQMTSTVSTIRINGVYSIWIQTEGFSSSIWNVLLKWSTDVDNPDSDTGWKAFHPVFEMFDRWQCRTIRIRIQTEGFSSGILSTIQIQDSDGRLFIRYLFYSNVDRTIQIRIQMEGLFDPVFCRQSRFIQTEGFSSGIQNAFYSQSLNLTLSDKIPD